MGDLKLVGVAVFTLIIFTVFMGIYDSSNETYNLGVSADEEIETDISSFDALKTALGSDTGSDIGNIIMGGIATMLGFVILRYIRGQ